jgi:hypothetical protein
VTARCTPMHLRLGLRPSTLARLRLRSLTLVAALAAGCLEGSELPVPAELDWVERGVVLRAGAPGAWDALLAGGSAPGALIVKDGTYLLYYGGADGSRAVDGGPRHRAIGVATSPDGRSFTKHPGNPVLSHLPNRGEEEGANSVAVTLDADGQIVALYGAATEIDSRNINADGRLALSSDGLEFHDTGIVVLDHRNESLYGYGDEIFPLAAYRHGDLHVVYYVVGGGPKARDLAVAWGPGWDRLDSSALVVDGTPADPARMAGNVIWIKPDRIVLFVQRGWTPNIRVEARWADPAQPHRLSDPVRVYDGALWKEQTKFFTVYLDRPSRTWLLYRLDWHGQIVLHVAPWNPRVEPERPNG